MGSRESSLVLLADDNENDVLMFRRAARRANFNPPLHVVSNGEETIAYLKGNGKYDDRAKYPLPGMVLLDLKMPRTNGFEVLQWVREQPAFDTMQVVVLTTSDEIRDINRAYELGANSFLTKPLHMDEFKEMMSAFHKYWIMHAQSAPKRGRMIDKPDAA